MPTKKTSAPDKKQAIDAKRTSSDYMMYPEDLHIETNPAAPLYDPRVELPVEADQIETWAITGATKDVVCRKNGDRVEVIDGLQTVKTALAVNRNRVAHDAERVQVRVTLRALPDNASVLLFREIANRRKKSLPSMTARQAATMLAQGIPRESIILAVEGIGTEKVLDRLLAFYELAPEVKRAVDEGALSVAEALRSFKGLRLDEQPAALVRRMVEGKPKALSPKRTFPSIDTVRRVQAKAASVEMHPQAAAILEWAAGKVTREELIAAQPALAPAFGE